MKAAIDGGCWRCHRGEEGDQEEQTPFHPEISPFMRIRLGFRSMATIESGPKCRGQGIALGLTGKCLGSHVHLSHDSAHSEPRPGWHELPQAQRFGYCRRARTRS
jgi:hypothetical protein